MSAERDPLALLNMKSLDEVIRATQERRKPIREVVYMLEDLVNDLSDLAECSDRVVRPMKPHDVAAWLVRVRALIARLESIR